MKKFVKVVCLFLVCSNFCIFSVEKSENANKKTAIRCMDLAESCIYSENFEDAIKNVNMGLQYDDSISDLYYLKASAFVKLGRTKNEILQEIKIAFDKNNWLGYNKDGARILYADLLCDTAEHEKSLEIHTLLDEIKWEKLSNKEIGIEAMLADNILIRYEVIIKTINKERGNL